MSLNKVKYYLSALLLICSLSLSAQSDRKNGVSLYYNVNFEMDFDNRELYRSQFSSSMTIFGARLTPSIGVNVRQKNGTEHKAVLGMDVMKDFGRPTKNVSDLLGELTLYYRMDKSFGKTDMTLCAGVFPRRFMDSNWSGAFFSDSLKFYDNNLEGLLLKFRRPGSSYELGCDWMGMKGPLSRERFMIFTSGLARLLPFTDYLNIGYSAYLYHFACSDEVDGVVDNALAEAYLKTDLASLTSLQTLSFSFGWLQSGQNDRKNIGKYTFPCGLLVETDIRKWNMGIKNSLFFGTDMMPLYNRKDAGGYKYGNLLYMGEPFFRVHDDGTQGWGTYDRLDIYWEPSVGKYLKARLAATFHFNGKYSGCQQVVSLVFDLDQLLKKSNKNKGL